MDCPYVGHIYRLKDCPASVCYNNEWMSGAITGEFEVLEFLACEPSMYVWSNQFTLIAPETINIDDDTPIWSVEEWDLIEQIDPPAFERMQKYERELDNAEQA